MAISYSVDTSCIPSSLRGASGRILRQLMDIAESDFDKITANDTNPADFRVTISGNEAEITTADEYFNRRNFGTQPRVIRPVRAQALRFPESSTPATTPGVIGSRPRTQSSTYVYAKSVNHPGIRRRDHELIVSDHLREVAKKIVCDEIAKLFR